MAEIVDGKIKLSIKATEIEEAVTQTKTNTNQIATLTTSVENKVDKVVGKSLVDDTEIERLASVENYDDTIVLDEIGLVQADVTTLNEAVFEEESTITDNSCIIEVADSTARILKDGVELASGTLTNFTTGTDLLMANHFYTSESSNFYPLDFMIYKKVLTDEEIKLVNKNY